MTFSSYVNVEYLEFVLHFAVRKEFIAARNDFVITHIINYKGKQ